MLAKEKSTRKGEVPSPSASPKHRPPRTFARAAPAAKQTHHKQVNPNSEVVYNHRARFSRFKRRIHAQRRWVVEGHTAQSVAAAAGHQEQDAFSAEGDSAVLGETREQWKSQPADTSASRPVAAATSSSSSAPLQRAVARMDALFGQLDAAVKQRRLGRVAFLRRCLRARQQHLRRSLLSTAQPASGTVIITTASSIREVPADSSPSSYRSFHPPSTWLGVGRHPSSEWVDQRSGRYPKTCAPEQIQFVLRSCADDDGPAQSVPTAQQAWLHRLPTLPADLTKTTAENTEAAASSPAAVTRAQRQLKASLFVAAYCANLLTDTLDDVAFTLLQGLYKEQRDLKQRQPLQFKARQRYVVGFQEVLKCLKAGRVRLVLLAADVEAVDAPEAALHDTTGVSAAVVSPAPARTKPARRKAFQSLHEAVAQVQQLCGSAAADSAGGSRAARAPPLCITCMSRQRLSYALYAKGSKVGCVGVMQAEKNRDALKAVMACGRLLTEMYASRESESVPAEKSGV